MTDKLEDMRARWKELSVKVDQLEEANKDLASRLSASKVVSSQRKLYKNVIRNAFCGLLLPVLAPMLVLVLNEPIWIAVLYGAFGIFMSTVQFIFAHYIDEKNLTLMPVSEAVIRATKIKEYQSTIRIAGVITGLLLLTAFVICLPGASEPHMATSLCIGASVGLVVGITKALRDHFLAKKIISGLTAHDVE